MSSRALVEEQRAPADAVPPGEPASATGAPRALQVAVIDGSAQWRQWWQDLWVYRGALRSLMWRNVRSRYRQAVLGMSWAVLQPVVQVGVFTVIFGVLANVPSEGVPYPLFALAGLLPWNFFQRTVSDGAASLVVNQHLITKLFFPRIYLVIAAGASAMLDALVTFGLLAILMAVYGVAPGPYAPVALAALAGVVLVTYGIASLLGALNARWRDIQHTVPFFLQVGLFVTPVLYREAFLPDRWQWIAAINPLAGLIEVFRSAVLGLPLPPASTVLPSLGIALALAVVGVWLFRRSEAAIVDVV